MIQCRGPVIIVVNKLCICRITLKERTLKFNIKQSFMSMKTFKLKSSHSTMGTREETKRSLMLWQHATVSYGSQKASMQSKRKQTEAEALYWVSVIFLYSFVPHSQNLIGEGLLTHGCFVLLIDHLASFTRPSRLARSWGLASLFLSSCSSTTAAQYFLLKDIDEIHQDHKGCLRPSRLPHDVLEAYITSNDL